MAKRLKDLAVGTKDLFMLDPRIIREEPGWNVRQDTPELRAHIRQLADSIKEVGVKEPVTVYLKDGVPYLTNGHCRLRATLLAIEEGADIRAIKAIAEERHASAADRVLGMLTRNSGKALAPLEQAEVFKRLLAFGWSEAEVARKAGFSSVHVVNMLRLGAAPAPVTEMVRNGEVSARLAVETIQKEGDGAADTLGEALRRAREAGKTKATGKHLPGRDAGDGSPGRSDLGGGIRALLEGPRRGPDWNVWGPRIKSALEGLLEALDRDDSWEGRAESEQAARLQLEEMERGGR